MRIGAGRGLSGHEVSKPRLQRVTCLQVPSVGCAGGPPQTADPTPSLVENNGTRVLVDPSVQIHQLHGERRNGRFGLASDPGH